ncbi:MAG: UDP-N-acetylglucosamine 2-epimerase (non-hydrolyzing), partial [Woeseia sp.]|nr:UDP-N-acetylglucosamine 2-epimerase (non-hydrolyzing) [Woeseia sp.]
MSALKVHLIAAARPNFMKVAPLFHALAATDWAHPMLVHTGQHYDRNMSDAILEDLGVPEPDFHLGIGSGTHAEQTGNVMIAYEKICLEHRPDWIVVVGDVNPTAACAMVGTKLWIPVIHLEAGLRSGDRKMPEEINRLVTDAIADVLWTPSPDADENLIAEGVAKEKIDMIGNIMIDSFEMLRSGIEAANTPAEIGMKPGSYALVTLHRPSNVDALENLQPIVDALLEAAKSLPVVFVAHPRTIKGLEKFSLRDKLEAESAIKLLDPVPYVKFMSLVTGARAVITDSGGLQEETTYLGIPCLTLRENTERPITV